MTEPGTEPSCRQCRKLAAELALGVLPSVERARALAHLDRCTACRNLVSALTRTGDRLVELVPSAEPPAGFEDRVMAALVPSASRRLRWWVPAGAVVAAIALLGGGWALGRATRPGASLEAGSATRAVLFAPLTAGGQEVGQAFLYRGQPSWIYSRWTSTTPQPAAPPDASWFAGTARRYRSVSFTSTRVTAAGACRSRWITARSRLHR